MSAPQFEHADAREDEYWPAPQVTQVLELVAPVACEYLPAPQFEHSVVLHINIYRFS